MSKNTFRFSAVVTYEVTEEEAVQLLSEDRGDGDYVNKWLSENCPVRERESVYNANEMKSALGRHLAARRVEEVRQLCAPMETTGSVSVEGVTIED